jgi:hypothetical protein
MKNYKKLTKREILLVGAGVVCACAAGYFGYKYFNDNKDLRDSVDTLMAAASEGVFEEALGTVNHKITYRADKEQYLMEYLKSHPNENKTKDTLEKVRIELINLYNRKDKIEKVQQLYEIKSEI